MSEVAAVLRERLGEDAAKVPTRAVPNLLVRAMALFDPGVRSILGQLGQEDDDLEREGEDAARLVPAPARRHDRRMRAEPARPAGLSSPVVAVQARRRIFVRMD